MSSSPSNLQVCEKRLYVIKKIKIIIERLHHRQFLNIYSPPKLSTKYMPQTTGARKCQEENQLVFPNNLQCLRFRQENRDTYTLTMDSKQDIFEGLSLPVL